MTKKRISALRLSFNPHLRQVNSGLKYCASLELHLFIHLHTTEGDFVILCFVFSNDIAVDLCLFFADLSSWLFLNVKIKVTI